MSINWIDPKERTPIMGARVLIICDGSVMQTGRLTNNGWHDDQAMPLRNVTAWTFVDGPDGAPLE